MDLLPVFLNIRERHCLVVGGGEVALRKVSILLRAGGRVTVVAERLCRELHELAAADDLHLLEESFNNTHLQDAVLVVAATDDTAINAEVSKAAQALDVPVNVVDQPALCTFIMPAIVDRSPVVVAISTGGSSPVLTRHLKELNETLMPGRIDRLAKLLGSKRKTVRATVSDFDQRIRFWEAILDSEIPELVYSGAEAQAEAAFDAALQLFSSESEQQRGGEVYLVGAGPGDPDLLTLRALRLMHKADVVLYDRLVSKEILLKVRPDAEKIHVGKQPDNHPVPQETINDMLVRLAKQGKRVLRLKGGDPFIFGRGGEELRSLAEQSIPFQVVPGITAASGCAAYAGIPLTHRDYAQSVCFLTGHLKNGEIELDWQHIITDQQTLVFYMGMAALPQICEKLIANGMQASMPVAVVQQGTTSQQKVVIGTLIDIADKAQREQLQAPSLTIIGEVVKLHASLDWYQSPADD